MIGFPQNSLMFLRGILLLPPLAVMIAIDEPIQFLGVDPAYTYIAQGLVIIIAVALDLRKYLAKK